MDLLAVVVVAATEAFEPAAAAAVAVDSTVMHCNYSNDGAGYRSPWIYFLCYEIWGIFVNRLSCATSREARGPNWTDSGLACTGAVAVNAVTGVAAAPDRPYSC